MSDSFDVIVIGGGPVGLWLASELALAKVRVIVLERRIAPVTQSRALSVQGRTLEVFALRGLADRFLSRGRTVPVGHFGCLGTPLDFTVFDSRFPCTLLIPQAITEALLEQRALELGVDVRRGHLVEGVQTTSNEILVEGRNGETPFRITARYAVGADGARSLVRRAAGIDFPGHPAKHSMMLGDVVLDAPPTNPLVTIVNEAGSMLFVSLGDGQHHRIVVVDAEMAPSSQPPTLTELAAAAARVSGIDARPRDPIWLSRFTDETRLADSYRLGRILLAGDAAHIHAPMGGQGMNVGIQDAMNLGWKLAAVIHGTASQELLDTYELERRPVGEMLRRNTLAQLAVFCNADPAILALRTTLEGILRVPEVNRQLADEGSGFSVSYPQPVIPPAGGWKHQDGLSGRRLPDMDLVVTDGSATTLYRLLEQGRWARLQFLPGEAVEDAEGTVVAELAPGAEFGLLANLASALVRPDGHLSHVRPLRPT